MAVRLATPFFPAKWTITDTIRPDLQLLSPEAIGVNSYPCISRFACHGHDDPVFKQIDSTATFAPQLREHQFLLAFRGIAGATALAEGALTYITDEIKRQTPRRVRRQTDTITVNLLKNLVSIREHVADEGRHSP